MNARHVTIVVTEIAGSFVPAPSEEFASAFLLLAFGCDLDSEGEPDETKPTQARLILALETVASMMVNLTACAASVGLADELRALMRAEINARRAEAN